MSEIKQLKELEELKKEKEKLRERLKEIERLEQETKKQIKPISMKKLRVKQINKWGSQWIILENEDKKEIERVKKETNKNIKYYRDKFKTDNTLIKDTKKVRLTNVTEYQTDNLKNLKKGEKFQYAYSVMYNGKLVTARSTQFKNSDKNKEFAEKHATDNLKRKLSYLSNGVSDSDVGGKILKDKNLKIKKSIIYYRRN